jgi:hypothetical protein
MKMRTKLVYFLIFSFCVNLIFFPLSEIRDFDTCLTASSKLSVKSDIFFTGYVALMMKLAMDIVSDGKTLPAPVRSAGKSSKQSNSTSDKGAIWLRGDSLTDTLNVSALSHNVLQYIVSFMPDISQISASVFWRFSMCVFLFSVMLVYLLPRGAIDDYVISDKYISGRIPVKF